MSFLKFNKKNLTNVFVFLSFFFLIQGSDFRYEVFYIAPGFSFFDFFLVLSSPLILSKIRLSCLLRDNAFICIFLFVSVAILSDVVNGIFRDNVSLASIKRVYFLYLFVVLYHVTAKSKDTLHLLNALLGIFFGGALYFIIDFTYSVNHSSIGSISGIQLLNDANVIGQVLVFASLSSVLAHRLTKNYLYVVFYILMMFPVVMTYSKAAWLQYFLLYFLFGIRWNLFLLIFFILAVSLFASELYDVIGFKISQTASGSLSTRIDYFLYASVGSLYSPFLGHGSGSFFEINKYFNLNILPGNNSHNAFSEILFNYGFFAFFTFAFFFWCTIRRLFNVIYGSAMHPLFNFKFLIIISVFLIYPMVQLQVYSQPWFYALSGLMGGYYARPTAPSRA